MSTLPQTKPKRLSSEKVLHAVTRLTDRDKDVILALYTHKLMTTAQIHRWFYPDVAEQNRTNIRKRMASLEELGFVGVLKSSNGRPQNIYYCADVALRVMAVIYDKRFSALKSQYERKALETPTLDHTLAIVDVRVAFAQAQHRGLGEVVDWAGENEFIYSFRYLGKKYTVRPDARGEWGPEGNHRNIAFLLEVDRGTANISLIEKKVFAYVELLLTKEYVAKEASNYFPLLLFVCNSEARAEAVFRRVILGVWQAGLLPSHIEQFITIGVTCSKLVNERGVAAGIWDLPLQGLEGMRHQNVWAYAPKQVIFRSPELAD